ncbi:uncharacterized protein LOC127715943 [Mytilus californianus]|uniref:uncharacterized protein LOC127715943 n=1 Tax=Mytilus californianus TaxID=6549 RepID=UPI0022453AF9|nr:uncharacterized protein LOC127715943 [Mytilus californianus]
MIVCQQVSFWIFSFILLLQNHDVIDGACLFPMNSGTWLSTDKGSLSITSSIIIDYQTSTFGSLSFECYTSSGTKYVARSTTFTRYGVDVRAYVCFKLVKVTTFQYYYYEDSVEESTLNNERMKTVANTATVTVDDICDRTAYAYGSYNIMVQDGYASEAASTCSSTIQGDWSYNFTDSSGNTACDFDSSVDICTDKSALAFNYTQCPQNIMYSAQGELYCLYSSSGNSMTYQHVLNLDTTTDESTTYRISCLVISSDGNTRYMTQYPNNCYDGQTSKSVSSPGALIEFSLTSKKTVAVAVFTIYRSRSFKLAYTEEENFTAAIALGVIVPLILIIIIAVIGYKLYQNYKFYQENKEVDTPKPDPKYANGEIRNKRMCKSNGVMIDEKALINDTPRSVEIQIEERPRPDSTLTTGSLLSAGIRRESSILLDINPSTRGTMVAESLPEVTEPIDYSSEYSDSDDDDQGSDNFLQLRSTGDFLDGKRDEGSQTPNIPQIVLDSISQGGDIHPDLISPIAVPPAMTTIPEHQSDATQTEQGGTNKKKKKRVKRTKSASSTRRVSSALKRRPGSSIKRKGTSKQKPDRYGNTDDKLVFGTRINILRIRPKSFRKKKQVNPLITDEDCPIDPSLNDLDMSQNDQIIVHSNGTNNDNNTTETGEEKEIDDNTTDDTLNSNPSKSNLKRNESMLREKIYRHTNRDIPSSKRKKKQPKLRHPLEQKKGDQEPLSDSWFKHRSTSVSRTHNTSDKKDETDGEGQVSPEVDEYGNLLPQSDNDSLEQKLPLTQQKPFMNPKAETTEEVFEKIKTMWQFGNRWLGNTYIAHSPK